MTTINHKKSVIFQKAYRKLRFNIARRQYILDHKDDFTVECNRLIQYNNRQIAHYKNVIKRVTA
jgi:hypothetical protein